MISVLKGTHDVILDEARKYSYIEELLVKVAELYNYKEFRTPIIESNELFVRGVGEGADIVRKEMYTFLDKGNRLISLRPEFTAGIIRSIVNNKLYAINDFPIKAFYVGPNFRYERPQQGRYRQFNQFGIECVGVDNFYRDVEVISLGYNALKLLGFNNIKLKINSLGDAESTKNYRIALNEFFKDKIDSMCDDCKDRFNKNILRILDCKVPSDIEIIKNAPKISDYLSENAKKEFEDVLKSLSNLNIDYEIDNNLVRGLDYYTGVVFEYQYTSSLSKNYGALGGGGHYSNLVKEIGGPDLEGVGLAFGIERLASVMNDDNLFDDLSQKLDIYIMPFEQKYYEKALKISNYLRLNGYSVDVCYESKGFSQLFKKAERRNALFALIFGENEIESKTFVLKNLKTTEQIVIKDNELLEKLDELFELNEDEHEHNN